MQLQQEKHICKSNLLRKCGLLAHTSPAFLKNCCTEKLFSLCSVSCETLQFFHSLYIFLPTAHTTFITTEKEGVPYGKFHWARGISLLASHPHPCNGCHCRRKRRTRANVCLLRPHLFGQLFRTDHLGTGRRSFTTGNGFSRH